MNKKMYRVVMTAMLLMGKGWDTEQRSVEIIQVNDGELFKVFNCPSLYTQCKNIKGAWEGLK